MFNEKYIDENVKIDADGLGTIILLGGQVDLQADIDHYAALLATAQREYDAAESALEAFGNKHNPLSPDYHLARIKKYYRAIGRQKILRLKVIKPIRR